MSINININCALRKDSARKVPESLSRAESAKVQLFRAARDTRTDIDTMRFEVMCLRASPGTPSGAKRILMRRLLDEGAVMWTLKKREVKPKKLWTEAEDGVAQCEKCGSRKTQFRSVQNRGGDEGQTTFVWCLNPECLHKWSMG